MKQGLTIGWAFVFIWAWPALAQDLVQDYIERYFELFPTAATAAGRHERDHQLERLDAREVEAWLDDNRRVAARAEELLADPALPFAQRLDLELLERQARQQILDHSVLEVTETNPLFWTRILGNATVFLLVRDDLPVTVRLESATARAEQIPRLVETARRSLARAPAEKRSAELFAMAERQARSTAAFYAQGFPKAAPPGSELEAAMRIRGARAAAALGQLADSLAAMGATASGSFRLGEVYGERFRVITGVEEPVSQVLESALLALVEKRRESAAYGREIWPQVFPAKPLPRSDRAVVEALFERLGSDRAATTEEFVEDYRSLVGRSVDFVRQKDIITLPEPLTLVLDRSPAYFVGQTVGGVYPAGPWASAEAKTLLFLPTPPDSASSSEKEAFFRDFNHHFNVMITPHELIPGHYLQLKLAARQPHKIRALFGDGVYIEGWGTFAERLMLDLGWGGPLDRMAHLKKQLENIARTIVDIRVHTEAMERDQVMAFVQNEALQKEQFAENMWRRAISSSPQLTFYFLGYREVMGLFEAVRAEEGSGFELKRFMDGMMELGPVPVEHYRRRMLGR